MDTTIAVRYHKHGAPGDVLKVERLPLEPPGPAQVVLKLLYAPIHPSDFGVILGKYGSLPELPATGGREGVGEVVAVGDDVDTLKPGDRVCWPESAGSWQSGCVAEAEGLCTVPNDIPAELAAMASINPATAWRILRDGHLDTGDWVIQNAANSAVGLFVIQLARYLNVRTINVVRRPELIEPLKEFGADAIVTEEEEDYPKRIDALTNNRRPKLALNSIGGPSVNRLIRSLAPGGTVVTIGAMDFTPIRFPTRNLIFDDVTLRGFWLDRWLRNQSRQRVQIMFDKLFSVMLEGGLKAPVEATYPLESFQEALAHNARPRLGKVLFRGV